ncbi:MAG: hypothetical protein GY725_04565 [bacterium]|nr:hypothetical protein [bacterium]
MRGLLLILLGLLILAGGFFLKLASDSGAFAEIDPHFSGSCRLVKGALGTEDVTIHPDTGIAYVSASDRRGLLSGYPLSGAIYAYDLADPQAKLLSLTPEAGPEFQPHGISLWRGPEGRERLFAINHPPDQPDEVQIFDLVGGRLDHVRTVTDPGRLFMPNDLVATGPEQFYVTSTHVNPPGGAQLLENILSLKGAKILYFDGKEIHTAVGDLVFPNGINIAPDGLRVYVSTTTLGDLLVFDRDPETGTLSHAWTLPVGNGLDNIEIDATGALWIGAHPKTLDFLAHAGDPDALSPSQALRITPDEIHSIVDEVYLDDGSQLSGSSVAARRGERLLIGQVFGDGILDCTMKSES